MGILRSCRARVGALALVAMAAAVPAQAGTTPQLTLPTILSGYSRPVLVTNDGVHNDRLFIVEQTGRIMVARRVNGSWTKQGVFLDLRHRVNDPTLEGNGERGLLGLAFDPDYATNGRFYVNYTREASGGKNGDTVIAEFQRQTTQRADPGSRRVVLVIDQPQANHNGGQIAFGPDDDLYIGMGDGGGQGDPNDVAQDLSSPLGKFLRIDPADPDGSGPKRFAIPNDNPYVGETEKRPEIWLSGTRNPWRWSFDRTTGDLWIADVGGGEREEIDKLPATGGVDAGKGLNLGWDVCEGDEKTSSTGTCDHGALDFTGPLFDFRNEGGPLNNACAVAGGYVYRGPGAPDWQGVYLFADYCTGVVGVLSQGGQLLYTKDTSLPISALGERKNGEVFVVAHNGTIRQVVMAGDPTP